MGHIAEVQDPATERVLLVDDEGRGLRASWHLDCGFVNLSIWKDDRCSETFHLSVGDAARLAGFLTEGLGQATVGLLRVLTDADTAEQRRRAAPTGDFTRALRSGRARLASWIAPSG